MLDWLHDEALWHAAAHTELFVEVDPRRKERIIVALKEMEHVVGFLGDGVNDAPAMHVSPSMAYEPAALTIRVSIGTRLEQPDPAGRRRFGRVLSPQRD